MCALQTTLLISCHTVPEHEINEYARERLPICHVPGETSIAWYTMDDARLYQEGYFVQVRNIDHLDNHGDYCVAAFCRLLMPQQFTWLMQNVTRVVVEKTCCIVWQGL